MRLLGAELFHADRLLTKLIVAFRNFPIWPKTLTYFLNAVNGDTF
jgi:hypothetical protein